MLVIQATNGMANIVKYLTLAQLVEYGIQHINNVSVQMATIGQAITVYPLHNAMVANISILLFQNVHAFQASNGMANIVYSVEMVKHGILLVCHALAHWEHSK